MKKLSKKFSAVVLVLAIVLSLSACGGGEPDEVVVLQASHSVSTTHPYHLGLVKYKELVEERTNGMVQIEIFDSGLLGDERASIEGLQLGTIDIAVSSTGPIGNFVSDFLVLDLPYLFPDTETARMVLDSEIGDSLLAQLDSIGVTGAAFWENGFRQFTNSKRPINGVEDLEGLVIRTQENEIHLAAFRALGADPTPMTWSDVFASLQQGVIDGQENPIAIIQSQSIFEVNEHLAITNHVYSPACLLISNTALEQFDEETQQILIDAAKEAGEYERQLLSEGEAAAIADLEEKGMMVTYPDVAPFVELAQSVYPDYEANFSEGLLESILEMTS